MDGEKILNNVSFRIERTDKVAFLCENEIAVTTLFEILMGHMSPDEGEFKWGATTSQSYFPKDNSVFFDGNESSIIEWLRQYVRGNDNTDTYLRSFLGRMLFSGDDVFKPVKVAASYLSN